MLVRDAIEIMKQIAPPSGALEWDNPGLQMGRLKQDVTRVIFALDLNPETVAQAIEKKAEMIITHHPVIYQKLARIADDQWQQELLLTCAEHGIAVFAAHTNWDAAAGGVNDVLASLLGLEQVTYLDEETKIGRIGLVRSMELEQFVAYVKDVLGLPAVTYIDGGKKVRQVAICGGAGMDFLPVVQAQGCDTFLTADIKYHQAQSGAYGGLNLVDGTHQGTEMPAMQVMLSQFQDLSGLECFLAKEMKIMKVVK